jgi:hypothetical protein
MDSRREPVCVALVNDHDVVLVGLAKLLDPYTSRVVVAELDTNQPVLDDVKVVLYDTFAQPEADQGDLDVLVSNPHADHVARTRGTSTQRSSRPRSPRALMATSPRHCRHGHSSRPSKRSPTATS